MKPKFSKPRAHSSGFMLAVVALLSLSSIRSSAVGFWTALANSAPGGVNTMLMLSDGTVMAQNGGNTTWYRLTPDGHGSYANGTWTTRTAMHYPRLYYSSQVLQDGRVFIAGAEYGTGTTNAEIYNPTSDSWQLLTIPAGLINMNNSVDPVNGNNRAGFIDSGSKILANGNVLIFPVAPFSCGETVIFNPFSTTFFQGPNLYRGCSEDEASCVKLPDNSVLSIDSGSTGSSRYIPGSNTIINDTTCPVSLYDPFGTELGPAFLLPNGKAIFFGSTTHTAIYTPSGSTTPGTWVAGPDYPNGQGMPDAPGAMMPDGKILIATSPTPISSQHFPSPVSYYEYDYTVGSVGGFTQVSAPGGGLTTGGATYPHRMLVLPSGHVLYTTGGSQLYVYTPGGAPLTAGKPVIYGWDVNLDGSLHISGTVFNGISEGANYGDDAQMDSNYPLVRLSDGSGNVTYARTYNWSSTSVQTGGQVVTTEALILSLSPGFYNLQVVANGIASDAATFYAPVWVDFTSFSPFNFYFGLYAFPYRDLASGVASVAGGGEIWIKNGSHSAESMTITKPMTIRAIYLPTTVGN